MKLLGLGFLLYFPLLMQSAKGQHANDLKLKDYRPVSIYKTPQANIMKAKYPAVDMHSHDYVLTDSAIDQWVKIMDAKGIAKTLILSYFTGKSFDSVVDKYARYKDRFEIWCGFDYTRASEPDWSKRAVAELERCYKKGARGVGELGDKGLGEFYSGPAKNIGMHIDDPRMKPLIEKCSALRIPISIHVAEDQWMYEKSDSTNDGLMNAATWNVDMTKEGILGHDELVATLEHAVRDNPKTIFIACHLANCCSDLSKLGLLFDRYANLYADIGARFAEIAPIPKFVKQFIEKYEDRIVYGTDNSPESDMYEVTFRILESGDEHFYSRHSTYHWPLYGIGLSDKTLKKLYSDNAKKIFRYSSGKP